MPETIHAMIFHATACQTAIECCFDAAGTFLPQRVVANQASASEVIREASRRTGSQLFVLPQFSLHGFSMGRTSADWVNAATRIPGPETEHFGELARELNIWIAGTLCEVLDEFPGRYFLTGFIVAPSSEVVLRYRKLYAFSTKTRPGDVLTRYLGLFGREALFPVVRTPLGRLAMAIAGDVNWPEMTRSLALRGAEIILNPTAQALMPADRDTGMPCVRRVRAFENLCYVILANAGPLTGAGPMPEARLRSEIVDYQGRVLATADTDSATTVTAAIDIEALRRERALPMKNFLAQLQPELHAADYATARLWPADGWLGAPQQDPMELFRMEQRVWQQMVRSGGFEAAQR